MSNSPKFLSMNWQFASSEPSGWSSFLSMSHYQQNNNRGDERLNNDNEHNKLLQQQQHLDRYSFTPEQFQLGTGIYCEDENTVMLLVNNNEKIKYF